jgi:hypothetical protein
MKNNVKKTLVLITLVLSINSVSLFSQDTIQDDPNFIEKQENESKEKVSGTLITPFSFPKAVIVILCIIESIIIITILLKFSKKNIHPLFVAICTNAVVLIFAFINLAVISPVIGVIVLFIVLIWKGPSGSYKHQTKSGQRDGRYKDNHYTSSGDVKIVDYFFWSLVPMIILFYLFFSKLEI